MKSIELKWMSRRKGRYRRHVQFEREPDVFY